MNRPSQRLKKESTENKKQIISKAFIKIETGKQFNFKMIDFDEYLVALC